MNTRKVLSISKLSLALVLLFVLVKTMLIPVQTKEIFGPAAASGKDDRQADETIYPARLQTEDYAQIIAADLFGASNRTPDGWRSPLDASGPESSVSEELGLALLGTVSGNTEVARAVIKNLQNGVIGLYKTGQVVEGARIEAIEADAVILLYNERTRILGLTSWRPNSGSSNHISAYKTNCERVQGLETNLPDEKADTVVPMKVRHVQELLTKAVIEPYLVNGQAEGLRITGLEGLAAGKDFGLKDGDVIRTVNGHRLTSKQKAFQVFKKARSQETMTIELLRGNRLNKLSWTLW